MDSINLSKLTAINWLKHEAEYIIDDYGENNYDSDDVVDIIKELLSYIDLIEKENWKSVKICECAMAVSKIIVYENKGD